MVELTLLCSTPVLIYKYQTTPTEEIRGHTDKQNEKIKAP